MDYGTRNIETGAIVCLYDEKDLAEYVTREMGPEYEVVEVQRGMKVD